MTNQAQHAEQKHKATPQRQESIREQLGPMVEMAEQPDLLALQRAVLNPARATPGDILGLQRTAGNRAVSRLIQTKLTVGGAGDRYEQEADRVAEQVVTSQWSRPKSASGAHGQPGIQRQEEEEEVQTKPLAATITPLIQRQEEEEEVQTKRLLQRQEEEEEVQTKRLLQRQEEEEEVQTKPLIQRQAYADGSFEVGPGLERHLAANKGAGSPLPAETRAYMEPRFGADFGGVRLHSGSEAVHLNRELNAQAFTHGKDIYLGGRAPAPTSEGGQKLIAHELTHVIQQGGSSNRIARWGKGKPSVKVFGHTFGSILEGTSHLELTNDSVRTTGKEGFEAQVKADYGDAALDYLAGQSDKMDMRQDYLLSVNKKMGEQLTAAKEHRGMYAGEERKRAAVTLADQKQLADEYDKALGYDRVAEEAPNHAEAGMYRKPGQTAKTRQRIKDYFDQATTQWGRGDVRQSMYTLSLALHVAQDIGAHGWGDPGKGHDPRRFYPPPNKYATTGWVFRLNGAGADPAMGIYPGPVQFAYCDNKDKNAFGWEIGKIETWRLLRQFYDAVGPGIGRTFKSPGRIMRGLRGTARFLGKRGVIQD